MFSCVWLHFKKNFEKYFLVFGYVLENTIENTFSTCCSHFLTFSRLLNKYIISFIPQYKNTNKTQEKKSPNLVKLREEGRKRGDWVRRGAAIGTVLPEITIGAKVRLWSARCFARLRSARCFVTVGLCLARWSNYHERSKVRWAQRDPEWAGSVWVLVAELSSFSRSLSFARDPKMVWR